MARFITADDFTRVTMVSDPRFSPDGLRVAFVKRYVDAEKNKYRSEIWMKDTPGGEAKQFTGSASSDSSPTWSPDGTQIAFLSDRQKPKAQIFLISSQGGEARALTHNEVEGSFSSITWSSDGNSIAFLFRATPAAYTKEAVEARKTKEMPAPVRVHKALSYRGDGFGYYDGEFYQIGVASVTTGEITMLTSGDYDCGPPLWSADCRTVAFISDRNDDSDLVPGRDTIYTVPVEGGELSAISTPPGSKGALSWSPDGKLFAYIGNPDVNDPWGTNNNRVMVLPAEGGVSARDLIAHTGITAGYFTLGDVHDVGAGDALQWSADSASLYFAVSAFGDCLLCSCSVEGGDPTVLTPLNSELGGFDRSVATGNIAYTLASPTTAQELFLMNSGATSKLTSFNIAFQSDVVISDPLPIDPPNGDGGTVPGWILKPAGFEPGKKYPLVLYIHGGPHGQYGNTLFHELQWLAAEGFVVLYTNPRGSKGYGEKHTKAIWGDWGGPDFRDLMAAVDYAIELDYVDAERTAVMGGSYGGYMTALIVGKTSRFKCGIADRLVANRHSMSGTTDFPWRHDVYFKGNAWSNPEPLLDCSPISLAGNVTTPLLIIHSDGDLRCPVSQAEEMFAALRLQRKVVEFVRYPAETSHGMSRNGPPNLRLDRLERNLEWLRRWLGPV